MSETGNGQVNIYPNGCGWGVSKEIIDFSVHKCPMFILFERAVDFAIFLAKGSDVIVHYDRLLCTDKPKTLEKYKNTLFVKDDVYVPVRIEV